MTGEPRQLTLNLPVETRYETEDFIAAGANQSALLWINRWPDWPDLMVVLTGPAGTGKSHLAAIWAKLAQAEHLDAIDLSIEIIPRLVERHALVIEGCDLGNIDEHALFHLVNAARERQIFILLTARKAPADWGIQTPDLLSRLRLAPEIHTKAPDDALLRAVLFKLFADRQIEADPSVIDFIQSRIERSVAAARDFVEKLDREGLARGRRITRALASELVQRNESDEDQSINPPTR
jgi:chromosomal replication initiation ATPase DnaA